MLAYPGINTGLSIAGSPGEIPGRGNQPQGWEIPVLPTLQINPSPEKVSGELLPSHGMQLVHTNYPFCLLTSANLLLQSWYLVVDISGKLLGALGHVEVLLLIQLQNLPPLLQK